MNDKQKWYWVPGEGVKYERPDDVPATAVDLSDDAVAEIYAYRKAQVAYLCAEARAWDNGHRDATSLEVARIAAGEARVDLGVDGVKGGASDV